MKVVTLVNGSLTSHTTAIYALYYAKQLSATLILAYIIDKESSDVVEKTLEDIQTLATTFGIVSEFVVFENTTGFKQYVENKDIDMLFCSTMRNKSIYDKSFVTEILDANIKVDIAVVKIVKIGRAYSADKIIMPIRASKLSVNKFTLFATFSLTYNAKSEIYSVDKISRMNMASVSLENIKEKLQSVIFNLRHYLRLAKTMNFKFAIKHDYAFVENEIVQSHIAKHGYDLIIMGGHHEKNYFWKHPIDVLFDKPMVNTIYFIPFKDDL